MSILLPSTEPWQIESITKSSSILDPYHPDTDPPPPLEKNCLEGYTPYNHGCYRMISNTRKSWAEMRDECRSHSKGSFKSDLVSIHSSAEDAALHIRVMQFGASVWIGLKRNEVHCCTYQNVTWRMPLWFWNCFTQQNTNNTPSLQHWKTFLIAKNAEKMTSIMRLFWRILQFVDDVSIFCIHELVIGIHAMCLEFAVKNK